MQRPCRRGGRAPPGFDIQSLNVEPPQCKGRFIGHGPDRLSGGGLGHRIAGAANQKDRRMGLAGMHTGGKGIQAADPVHQPCSTRKSSAR